jgi:hypothetical protein
VEWKLKNWKLETDNSKLTTRNCFSAKRRQLHEIILRDGFEPMTGFTPRGETAGNHERVESRLPQ